MSRDPREGVDYLNDYYAIVGVGRDASPDDLQDALREKSKQYHPDLLIGRAPEFQKRGELVMGLLNRAGEILRDPQKRAEYDALLEEFPGPISKDGTPIEMQVPYYGRHLAGQTAEEIEASFADMRGKIELLSAYAPDRLADIEEMIEAAGGKISDGLRRQYEAALLQYDRVLALDEVERAKIIGVDTDRRELEAGFDYAAEITQEVDMVREREQKRLSGIALGGFASRLALLTGDSETMPAVRDGSTELTDIAGLPVYFDAQATRVKELAIEREAVLQKRLNNFEPDYPEAELQTEPKAAFIIGRVGTTGTAWTMCRYDPERRTTDGIERNEEIIQLLDAKDFAAVISRGYNVLTFVQPENIELLTMIFACVSKYLTKYGLETPEPEQVITPES